MALNFPLNPDDQSIYVDPTSGLKYIFNKAIGGWETAIQPPVIVGSTQPDITIDGFLWWDTAARNLYVLRGGQWTPVAGDTDGVTTVTVGDEPPPSPTSGDLWWDNVGGTLYIYYIDGDSSQWVIAAPNLNTDSKSIIYTGLTAPDEPLEGDMWFNTANDTIYVYHQGQWVGNKPDQSGQLKGIFGTNPIMVDTVQGSATVSIKQSSTTQTGACRFATQQEVSARVNDNIAVSPYRLSVGIDQYLPDATETERGVLKISTETQMNSLADDTTAVTPAKLALALNATGNPPGTVITYAGITPPIGYLLCDGQKLPGVLENYIGYVKDGVLVPQGTANSITINFSALVSVLGTSFSSNEVDSLLPDLRGFFVKGWHHGKPGVDSGRIFGEFQAQAIQTHNHPLSAGPADVAVDGNILGGGNRTTNSGVYQTGNYGEGETRPNNVALTYCIKY